MGLFVRCYFKSFDALAQLDFVSPTWTSFHEYPFSLGMTFPFSSIVSKFFEITQLSYIQVIPVIQRIFFSIDRLDHSIDLDIGRPELTHDYNLLTFVNSLFLIKVKTKKLHLILKSKQNAGTYKKYFFVRRDSIPNGDILPKTWVRKNRI